MYFAWTYMSDKHMNPQPTDVEQDLPDGFTTEPVAMLSLIKELIRTTSISDTERGNWGQQCL